PASTAQNSSLLKLDNVAKNRFWETLERNLKDLLRETDKLLPEGSSETFVQGRREGSVSTPLGRAAQRRTNPYGAPGVPGATPVPGTSTQGETTGQQAGEYVESRLTFREAASVIVNPESGTVTLRASGRQHE